jgi:hypothetical protein
MSKLDFLEKTLTIADGCFFAAGQDYSKLPVEMSNFLHVYSAQGAIDNGGFNYFFQNDWPEKPSYSVFILAYHSIGCHAVADALSKIVALFPFKDPQLYCKKRRQYISKHWDKERLAPSTWPSNIFSHHGVEDALIHYVLKHKDIFKITFEYDG